MHKCNQHCFLHWPVQSGMPHGKPCQSHLPCRPPHAEQGNAKFLLQCILIPFRMHVQV